MQQRLQVQEYWVVQARTAPSKQPAPSTQQTAPRVRTRERSFARLGSPCPRRRDRRGGLLRLDQNECRSRAFGRDRVGRCATVLARVFRLDVNTGDVDDARELAHALQERSEVVVRPLDLQA